MSLARPQRRRVGSAALRAPLGPSQVARASPFGQCAESGKQLSTAVSATTQRRKRKVRRRRAEQKGCCELAVKTLGNQNVSDDFIPAAAATQLGGNWGAQWKHPRFSSRVDPGVDLIVEHLQQG